jgi:hypothetical protein
MGRSCASGGKAAFGGQERVCSAPALCRSELNVSGPESAARGQKQCNLLTTQWRPSG